MKLALSLAVTLVLLAVTDAFVRVWNPGVLRLPEQFSPAFLEKQIAEHLPAARTTVFFGDSVLWGYRIAPNQTAPSIVGRTVPAWNLSYEGGSPVNSYVLLRHLFERGARPRFVVFNVNQKQFNPANSAYARLQPSVEAIVEPEFDDFDRRTIVLDAPKSRDIESSLSTFVSNVWALFDQRVDVREALFGTADAATALKDAAGRLTGLDERSARASAPTAEKFLGTYDLDPLNSSNVSVEYLTRLCVLLRQNHIPAVAILTPTNHALLKDYIDVPQYDANVRFAADLLRANHVTVLDEDRAFPAGDFLDSDHLTPEGNRILAQRVLAALGVTR